LPVVTDGCSARSESKIRRGLEKREKWFSISVQ